MKVPDYRGGYSVIENTQSPKICLNFNFRGGSMGGYSEMEKLKCQDYWQFSIGGGGILVSVWVQVGISCNWNLVFCMSSLCYIFYFLNIILYFMLHQLSWCKAHLVIYLVILYFMNAWLTTYIYYYLLLFFIGGGVFWSSLGILYEFSILLQFFKYYSLFHVYYILEIKLVNKKIPGETVFLHYPKAIWFHMQI